jgi:5'-methylthioadenosine phosphorylase/5'-methylthioinosine phosphorylase
MRQAFMPAQKFNRRGDNPMQKIAIIGGTGLSKIPGLDSIEHHAVKTPFGNASADFITGQLNKRSVVFLARHGNPHTIAPHQINYRANIWGLKALGVEQIIAVAAVGGITQAMHPELIAIPKQLIDYTYGRKHTFFEDSSDMVTHIDFTHPYTEHLRARLISTAQHLQLEICEFGVYGATQGPRLETAAEILRMEKNGCDLVGMTGMPEAALARELGIEYASLCVVANWAAGKSSEAITMQQIEKHLDKGMANVSQLLTHLLTVQDA